MKVTVDIDNIDDNSIDVLVFACKYIRFGITNFEVDTFSL